MSRNSSSIIEFDSLWYGAHAATLTCGRYHEIENAAIGVRAGRIRWLGPYADLPEHHAAAAYDLAGGWVTPGLVDCHTHLVFAGNRANEFEMRLNGVNYEAIAKAGGGIASSVNNTRKATLDELIGSAQKRLNSLMADGVTTVEIKSGYGLDVATELRMLQAAQALAERNPIGVSRTCLAAHALPPEYQGNADGYIDYLCTELLPAVAESGLVDAVDAFCEGIGFSPAQVERYFLAAQQLSLPLKLHAEQLSALGGASLAARYCALSADHLEYLTEADAQAMAQAGTVAVLLPGAYFVLQETQRPAIELLRQYQVPMAVATDANPGTSPVLSLRLMMNMACTLFALTPEEALAGVTYNAAKALGLEDHVGSLAIGKQANFIHWDIESPAELSYWLGGQLLRHRVYQGELTE